MVFSHHWIDNLGEKSYLVGGGLVGKVACRIILSVPVPLFWTLNFGFETLNLDLGLGTVGLYCQPQSHSLSFEL